jgi:hypothetical protein
MNSTSSKRPRISKGQVVRSTNPVKQSCIKTLYIVQYYNALTYNRIKRVVLTLNPDNEKTCFNT